MTHDRSQDEADPDRGDEAGVESFVINERLLLDWSNREVVIAWCLWLMGSWVVNHDVRSPLPAARWMVLSALVGMTLIWPVWRLSVGQSFGLRPAVNTEIDVDEGPGDNVWPGNGRGKWASMVSVWIDWINLNVVFQAVLWPLRLITGWSIGQTLDITYVVVAWSLLCFAMVAWGILKPNGLRRLSAMGGCVAVWFAEPMLMSTASHGPVGVWPMWVSPLGVFESMTQDPSSWLPQAIETRVVVVVVAAMALWVWVALTAWLQPCQYDRR